MYNEVEEVSNMLKPTIFLIFNKIPSSVPSTGKKG
jgi:hypothetical protein